MERWIALGYHWIALGYHFIELGYHYIALGYYLVALWLPDIHWLDGCRDELIHLCVCVYVLMHVGWAGWRADE